MMTRDSKKMAQTVLSRAFGGGVGSGNFKKPGAGMQDPSYSKGKVASGNYPQPSAGSQSFSNGGEVKYGKDKDMYGENSSFMMHGGEVGNYASPDADDQEDPEFAEGGEVDEGYIMAAEEILSALESKDPKQLAESLKSFVEQCGSGEMDEEGME